MSQHDGWVTEEGRLVIRDSSAWKRAIARLSKREVILSIKSASSQQKPSLDQFGYYRGVILPLLAEEWGWADQAELHYRLKEKHLPPIVPVERWPYRKLGNVEMREPPSMADLTVEETSAFLQAVIDHATEEGIRVPQPRGRVEA
jgi:hypothetical protein